MATKSAVRGCALRFFMGIVYTLHGVRTKGARASILLLASILIAGCGSRGLLRPGSLLSPEPAAAVGARREAGASPQARYSRWSFLSHPSGGDVLAEQGSISPASDEQGDQFHDVWAHIRAGLGLPLDDRPRVAREVQWFQHNQDYLDRTAERARLYLPYVVAQLEARDMPLELALLPIVESAYQPFAYSPARAAGIWQFLPSTGRRYGLKQDWWYDGRRDIVNSTRAALDYLQTLSADFHGDWLLAIAAYNSGAGNVQHAIDHNRALGKPTDFWSLSLPRETETYVPKLLALALIVADPQRFGIHLRSIPDEPYFDVVRLDGQIDLSLAADLAGISLEELYKLNPGYNRWATDPNGPFRLLLPAGKAKRFSTRLASVPRSERVHWARHVVHRGDTLGGIARHYGTSVVALRRVNKIHGALIRIGQTLLVPRSRRSLAALPAQELAAVRAATAAVPRSPVTHTVHAGDNLWSIARRFGTTIRKVAVANHISVHATLHPGMKLRIPRIRATVLASADDTRGGDSDIHRISYTVRHGDSLWDISRRFRVSVKSLRRWNELKHGTPLIPGQKLHLFVLHGASTESS